MVKFSLIEEIINFNFSFFKGDQSNLKNSFLSTRTMISINTKEIEGFFTKKSSDNKQKIEMSHPEQITNNLNKFIDFGKCSLISKI